MGGASRGRKQGVARVRAPTGRRGAYRVTYRRKGRNWKGSVFPDYVWKTGAKAGNSIGGGERAGLQSELGGALSKGRKRSKGTRLALEVLAVFNSHAMLGLHLEASPEESRPLQN